MTADDNFLTPDESTPAVEPAVRSPSGDPDTIVRKLVRASKRVRLEGEDGVERLYTLREEPGTLRGEWMNFLATRQKIDNRTGTVVGMKDFRGMESWLISKCMYTEQGQKVPQKEIEGWPAQLQRELFEACQKLNGLEDRSADLKNA